MSNSNPVDVLENPIAMGDIVVYTTAGRSANLEVGVVVSWDQKDSLSLKKLNYQGNALSKTTIKRQYSKFSRVFVCNSGYLRNPKCNPLIVNLHDDLKGKPWPQKQQIISLQSPVTKWVKSLLKQDFVKASPYYRNRPFRNIHAYSSIIDSDGYSLRDGRKFFSGKFTTTHNGETVKTEFYFGDSAGIEKYDIEIIAKGITIVRYSNLPSYLSNNRTVFGLDWFIQPEVEQAIAEMKYRVKNQ